jgi:hypothetical protein
MLILACLALTACSTRFNNPVNRAASTSQDTFIQNTVPKKILLGKSNWNGIEHIERGLLNPAGVTTDGTKLVIADTGLHRVLIYNSIPNQDYAAPDVVLGISSPRTTGTFYANSTGVSEKSLSSPVSVFIDGTRLYVVDSGNHRVLIWNKIPTKNQTPADIVLGQPTFNTGFANQGKSSPSASSLSGPTAVLTVGSKLLVADSTNNRIMIWNHKDAITSGATADVVMGQSNFTSNTAAGASSTTLRSPRGMASDGTKLLVADYSFNRVLIFNSVPTALGVAANTVLGQSGFTTTTANSGGVSYSSLRNPDSLTISGGKLFVSDQGNHRVLVWNSIPTVNKTAAAFSLGQTTTSGVSCNLGVLPNVANPASLCGPRGVSTDGTRLFVTDTTNQRVIIWKDLPRSSGTPGDQVVGQPSLVNYNLQFGSVVGADGNFNRIYDVSTGGGKLVASILGENRILIWNSAPKSSQTPADIVLGQPDFSSFAINNDPSGVSARTLSNPRASWTDGNRLIVADQNNHRVLIWSTFPKESYTPADVVLGQTSFSANSINAGGTISNKSLRTPLYLSSDGTRLVVADTGNHRLLIWNTIPTMSNTSADVVLGQADWTTGTANFGGLSNKSINNPFDVLIDQDKLFVIDNGNNRILIWNKFPTQNYTEADVVLGQPDFNSYKAYSGNKIGLSSFGAARGLAVHQNRLYTFGDNGRLLVWNRIPEKSSTPADWMYGILPSRFFESSENVIQNSPHFGITDDFIYTADSEAGRIIGLPHPPIGFYTSNYTSAIEGKLTAVDCSDISSFLINEGDRPLSSDSGWQACDTQPGALSFKLAQATEGVHQLKAWMKNKDGVVKAEPIPLPFALDLTPPLAPPIKLDSANPSATSAVTMTLGVCSDTPHVLITEKASPPDAGSPLWETCLATASGTSFTLEAQTGGNHSIYVWGKDHAGNVSQAPSSITVSY